MLRNEVNEEFWLSQSAYQSSVLEALRSQLLKQHPTLSETSLNDLLSDRVLGFVPIEEWHAVIDQLHQPSMVKILAPQVCQLAAGLSQSRQRGTRKAGRDMLCPYAANAHALPFGAFLQVRRTGCQRPG
jgi:hypothetical protein